MKENEALESDQSKEQSRYTSLFAVFTCARGKMTCIDSLHIGLNRFLLLTVGLWPYQQSILVQFQLTLLFSVLATFILVQVR